MIYRNINIWVRNKIGMKLDSISAISEISKFYGKLDDVFRLLNRLSTTTRKIWEDILVKLSEDVKRKIIEIDSKTQEMLVDISTENKYVLSLFELQAIDMNTKK